MSGQILVSWYGEEGIKAPEDFYLEISKILDEDALSMFCICSPPDQVIAGDAIAASSVFREAADPE